MQPDHTLSSRSNSQGKRWHVVHTKPMQEFRAKENLLNQGFEVFLPTITVERRKHGQRKTLIEALFSRYIFVQFDEEADPWHRIRNTLGVSALVRIGSQPARISDAMMAVLKAQDSAALPLFKCGDPIHIISGPLRGLEAVYEQKDGAHRAMILIDLLNKTQRVAVPLDAVVAGHYY